MKETVQETYGYTADESASEWTRAATGWPGRAEQTENSGDIARTDNVNTAAPSPYQYNSGGNSMYTTQTSYRNEFSQYTGHTTTNAFPMSNTVGLAQTPGTSSMSGGMCMPGTIQMPGTVQMPQTTGAISAVVQEQPQSGWTQSQQYTPNQFPTWPPPNYPVYVPPPSIPPRLSLLSKPAVQSQAYVPPPSIPPRVSLLSKPAVQSQAYVPPLSTPPRNSVLSKQTVQPRQIPQQNLVKVQPTQRNLVKVQPPKQNLVKVQTSNNTPRYQTLSEILTPFLPQKSAGTQNQPPKKTAPAKKPAVAKTPISLSKEAIDFVKGPDWPNKTAPCPVLACRLAKKTSDTFEAFQDHWVQFHSPEQTRYQCKRCQATCYSIKGIKIHINRHGVKDDSKDSSDKYKTITAKNAMYIDPKGVLPYRMNQKNIRNKIAAAEAKYKQTKSKLSNEDECSMGKRISKDKESPLKTEVTITIPDDDKIEKSEQYARTHGLNSKQIIETKEEKESPLKTEVTVTISEVRNVKQERDTEKDSKQTDKNLPENDTFSTVDSKVENNVNSKPEHKEKYNTEPKASEKNGENLNDHKIKNTSSNTPNIENTVENSNAEGEKVTEEIVEKDNDFPNNKVENYKVVKTSESAKCIAVDGSSCPQASAIESGQSEKAANKSDDIVQPRHQEVWPGVPTQCPVAQCSKKGKFKRFNTFNLHWSKIHIEFSLIYECDYCNTRFESDKKVDAHKKLKSHKDKDFSVKQIKITNKNFIDPKSVLPYLSSSLSKDTSSTDKSESESTKKVTDLKAMSKDQESPLNSKTDLNKECYHTKADTTEGLVVSPANSNSNKFLITTDIESGSVQEKGLAQIKDIEVTKNGSAYSTKQSESHFPNKVDVRNGKPMPDDGRKSEPMKTNTAEVRGREKAENKGRSFNDQDLDLLKVRVSDISGESKIENNAEETFTDIAKKDRSKTIKLKSENNNNERKVGEKKYEIKTETKGPAWPNEHTPCPVPACAKFGKIPSFSVFQTHWWLFHSSKSKKGYIDPKGHLPYTASVTEINTSHATDTETLHNTVKDSKLETKGEETKFSLDDKAKPVNVPKRLTYQEKCLLPEMIECSDSLKNEKHDDKDTSVFDKSCDSDIHGELSMFQEKQYPVWPETVTVCPVLDCNTMRSTYHQFNDHWKNTHCPRTMFLCQLCKTLYFDSVEAKMHEFDEHKTLYNTIISQITIGPEIDPKCALPYRQGSWSEKKILKKAADVKRAKGLAKGTEKKTAESVDYRNVCHIVDEQLKICAKAKDKEIADKLLVWPNRPTLCPVPVCANLGLFQTFEMFNEHFKTIHSSQIIYQCKSCKVTFPTEKDYGIHCKQNHKIKGEKARFERKKMLDFHLNTKYVNPKGIYPYHEGSLKSSAKRKTPSVLATIELPKSLKRPRSNTSCLEESIVAKRKKKPVDNRENKEEAKIEETTDGQEKPKSDQVAPIWPNEHAYCTVPACAKLGKFPTYSVFKTHWFLFHTRKSKKGYINPKGHLPYKNDDGEEIDIHTDTLKTAEIESTHGVQENTSRASKSGEKVDTEIENMTSQLDVNSLVNTRTSSISQSEKGLQNLVNREMPIRVRTPTPCPDPACAQDGKFTNVSKFKAHLKRFNVYENQIFSCRVCKKKIPIYYVKKHKHGGRFIKEMIKVEKKVITKRYVNPLNNEEHPEVIKIQCPEEVKGSTSFQANALKESDENIAVQEIDIIPNPQISLQLSRTSKSLKKTDNIDIDNENIRVGKESLSPEEKQQNSLEDVEAVRTNAESSSDLNTMDTNKQSSVEDIDKASSQKEDSSVKLMPTKMYAEEVVKEKDNDSIESDWPVWPGVPTPCPVLPCAGIGTFANFDKFMNHWKKFHWDKRQYSACKFCKERINNTNKRGHTHEGKYKMKDIIVRETEPNPLFIDPGVCRCFRKKKRGDKGKTRTHQTDMSEFDNGESHPKKQRTSGPVSSNTTERNKQADANALLDNESEPVVESENASSNCSSNEGPLWPEVPAPCLVTTCFQKGSVFTDFSYFEKHWKTYHQEKILACTCKICGVDFTDALLGDSMEVLSNEHWIKHISFNPHYIDPKGVRPYNHEKSAEKMSHIAEIHSHELENELYSLELGYIDESDIEIVEEPYESDKEVILISEEEMDIQPDEHGSAENVTKSDELKESNAAAKPNKTVNEQTLENSKTKPSSVEITNGTKLDKELNKSNADTEPDKTVKDQTLENSKTKSSSSELKEGPSENVSKSDKELEETDAEVSQKTDRQTLENSKTKSVLKEGASESLTKSDHVLKETDVGTGKKSENVSKSIKSLKKELKESTTDPEQKEKKPKPKWIPWPNIPTHCPVTKCKNRGKFKRFAAFLHHWYSVHHRKIMCFKCESHMCKLLFLHRVNIMKHKSIMHPYPGEIQKISSFQILNKSYIDPEEAVPYFKGSPIERKQFLEDYENSKVNFKTFGDLQIEKNMPDEKAEAGKGDQKKIIKLSSAPQNIKTVQFWNEMLDSRVYMFHEPFSFAPSESVANPLDEEKEPSKIETVIGISKPKIERTFMMEYGNASSSSIETTENNDIENTESNVDKESKPLWPLDPAECPVPECQKHGTFPTFVKFKAHWNNVHKDRKCFYQCVPCGVLFSDAEHTTAHRNTKAHDGEAFMTNQIIIPNSDYLDPKDALPYRYGTAEEREKMIKDKQKMEKAQDLLSSIRAKLEAIKSKSSDKS